VSPRKATGNRSKESREYRSEKSWMFADVPDSQFLRRSDQPDVTVRKEEPKLLEPMRRRWQYACHRVRFRLDPRDRAAWGGCSAVVFVRQANIAVPALANIIGQHGQMAFA